MPASSRPEALVLLLKPQWIGTSGLWRIEPGAAPQPVDAEEIGLSEDLADRLEDWTDTFDALYDEDEPAASRFHAREAHAEFIAEGEALAALIRQETGAQVRFEMPTNVKPEDA